MIFFLASTTSKIQYQLSLVTPQEHRFVYIFTVFIYKKYDQIAFRRVLPFEKSVKN